MRKKQNSEAEKDIAHFMAKSLQILIRQSFAAFILMAKSLQILIRQSFAAFILSSCDQCIA
jgi:hypothetical protein